MHPKSVGKEIDDMAIYKRRFETITVSRLRDSSRTRNASVLIDKIRQRTGKSRENTTDEIRKWRDKRYGSSDS